MRIVIDSESSRFKTFRRWVICMIVWFVIMIISSAIAHRTGWDMDFFEGYFSCVMMGYASGAVRKL